MPFIQKEKAGERSKSWQEMKNLKPYHLEDMIKHL